MKWNTYQGHEFENLSQYLFGGDLKLKFQDVCSKSILMEVSDIIIYIMKILGVLVLEFL